MFGFMDDTTAHLVVKTLWVASIALVVFLGVLAAGARARASDAWRSAATARAERDEALQALAVSHDTIARLEQRLALQSDSVRLSMASIDERLAEARRAKARERRIRALLAADPTAGESRCETAARRIDETLREPRTWSDPEQG